MSRKGAMFDPRLLLLSTKRAVSAAEGSSDLWLPVHSPNHSTVDALAKFGWIVATPKGDRVHIQLTNAGRAALAGAA
jgi:hypothetical protein